MKKTLKDILLLIFSEDLIITKKNIVESFKISNKSPLDYSRNCPICLAIKDKVNNILDIVNFPENNVNLDVQIDKNFFDFYTYSSNQINKNLEEKMQLSVPNHLFSWITIFDREFLKILGNKEEENNFIDSFKDTKFSIKLI